MKSIFEIGIPKSQLQSQTELYKGLFTVVGGSQNDYVTARRIGLVSNSTNMEQKEKVHLEISQKICKI